MRSQFALLLIIVGCSKPSTPTTAAVDASSATAPATATAMATATATSSTKPKAEAVRSSPFRAGRPKSKVIGRHADAVCGVAFSTDGTKLASGSFDGRLKIWPLPEGAPTELPAIKDEVCAIAFDDSGRWVAAGGWDNKMRVWEAKTLKLFGTVECGDGVKSVAFAHGGGSIACATLKGEARFFSLGADRLTMTKMLQLSKMNLNAITYAPDDRLVAVGGREGKILLLDAATFDEKGRCDTKGADIQGLSFFPGGAELVSGEGDDVVVRAVPSCDEKHRMKGHTSLVYSVAVAPSGDVIASSSLDASIHLWTADGAPIATLTDHNERVHAIAWSPDGQKLASVSGTGKIRGVPGEDNTVRLWTSP